MEQELTQAGIVEGEGSQAVSKEETPVSGGFQILFGVEPGSRRNRRFLFGNSLRAFALNYSCLI